MTASGEVLMFYKMLGSPLYLAIFIFFLWFLGFIG
jgi:hypothetical protein